MPALTFTPVSLSIVIRVAGGPLDPVNVRAHGTGSMRQTQTMRVSVGVGFPGFCDLSKVGGASWLSVATPQLSDVLFDVTVDVSTLKVGVYSEVVRASKAGYDSADLPVSLVVQAEGPPAKGPR
jgi:hypothetical protein